MTLVDSPLAAALAAGLSRVLPNLAAFDVKAAVVHAQPVTAVVHGADRRFRHGGTSSRSSCWPWWPSPGGTSRDRPRASHGSSRAAARGGCGRPAAAPDGPGDRRRDPAAGARRGIAVGARPCCGNGSGPAAPAVGAAAGVRAAGGAVVRAVVADLHWIRAVQHYGRTRLAGGPVQDYDILYPLLDVVTTLDPHFIDAHRLGAVFWPSPRPAGRDGPTSPRRCCGREWRARRRVGSTCRIWASCTTGGWATSRRPRAGSSGARTGRALPGGSGRWRRPRWPRAATAPPHGCSGVTCGTRPAMLDARRGDPAPGAARCPGRGGAPPAVSTAFANGPGGRRRRGASSWRPETCRRYRADPTGVAYELTAPDGAVAVSRWSALFPLPDGGSVSGAAAAVNDSGAVSDSGVAVVVALLGLAVGSFLNVCIHRLPRGASVVAPGSHCPACRRPVRWFDNVPVVSYLVLRRAVPRLSGADRSRVSARGGSHRGPVSGPVAGARPPAAARTPPAVHGGDDRAVRRGPAPSRAAQRDHAAGIAMC